MTNCNETGIWKPFEQQILLLTEGSGNNSSEGRQRYQSARETAANMALADFDASGAPSERLFWWARTVQQIPYEQFADLIDSRITVSLTSYPERIKYVEKTLQSIFQQTRKADDIILWLAEAQFPEKEKELPERLIRYRDEGKLNIRWCSDLKPHKKYFFAVREIRDGVVVTFDDDLILKEDSLELLLLSYIRHPKAVSALRTHLMATSDDNRFLPYIYWIKETDALIDAPCMQLIATTGAGTLYPAGLLPETVFDEAGIEQTCLYADDLWMKCNEVLADVPVVLACRYRNLTAIAGTEGQTLWENNRLENDNQLKRIIWYLNSREGEGSFERHFFSDLYYPQTGIGAYALHVWQQINRITEENRFLERRNKELTMLREEALESNRQAMETVALLKQSVDEIKDSLSYRLGRRIVRLLRRNDGSHRKE